MSIFINGTVTQVQPTILIEELLQIQSENMSIGGAMQRNKIAQKKQSSMEFWQCSPVQYQSLVAAFTTGSGVVYNNDQSDYSGGTFGFNGLPFFVEGQYVRGASLLRDFKVRIREI